LTHVFGSPQRPTLLQLANREINSKIVASRVPVIAYVMPSGGRASGSAEFHHYRVRYRPIGIDENNGVFRNITHSHTGGWVPRVSLPNGSRRLRLCGAVRNAAPGL
jgi:hypothetical protein